MIKKLLILMLLVAPLSLRAQYTTGDWRIHSTFVAAQAQNCIDTGDKVYYLASGCLFCFDKSTQENESLDRRNYLSDINISDIYYNYTKRYLVVTYANSNIDVITAEGKIVNMPEIKDAVVTSSKKVNDVTFPGDGTMLVATDFGYVVVDDSQFIIKESHLYYKPFSSLIVVGERLVAVIDGTIYVSSATGSHDALSVWATTNSPLANGRLRPINNTKLFAYHATKCYVGTLGGTVTAPKATWKGVGTGGVRGAIQPTKNGGFLGNYNSGSKFYLYTFDSNGTPDEGLEVAANDLYSCAPSGDGSKWVVSANGLHKDGDNANFYRPNSITISGLPFWSMFNPGQNKVYIHTSADNFLNSSSADCNLMEVSTYDGTTWRNETPDRLGTDFKNYSAYPITFNPNDANTYFFSTRAAGVYKVTNGHTTDIFTQTNTPGGSYRGATAFDKEGNLWVVYGYDSQSKLPSGNTNVVVLPKSKVNSSEPVVKADWKKVTISGIGAGEFKRGSFVVGNNDVKLYNDGGSNRPIFMWRDGMTTANPTVKTFTSFVDQDGKSVTWTYLRGMGVSNNGHIWLGLDGVVEFDPNEVFNGNTTVNHIKVPRNDGTGLADYLLEGLSINGFAFDKNNCAWIATSNGAYKVSPDGTQVLQQFNSSNSLLPSDLVFSVTCDTNSNSVFFVTSSGVAEFIDGTSAASSDLSNVHCYPNPVRPEFTGLLTINGLPDNTLVKIADSAGNVVKQMRSNGGIATWDCCGTNGERVATGVYYVMASTAGDSSSNVVTKFLVVK